MRVIIEVFKKFINFIYSILKKLPLQEKIVFCSRQSDHTSIDYRLIQEEIKNREINIKIVNICKRFENLKDGSFKFSIAMLRSMYHLATSKVCVLDGYWPAACILKHKESLKIIQIWHSIGKIKKSGYQTLDTKYGRKKEIADLLCMHKNYDYVIAGGSAWNKYYCESFNIGEEIIKNYGLPRIDNFIKNEETYRNEIIEKYPEFKGKKIVMYAPTFRKDAYIKWEELYKAFSNSDEYIFICRLHPNQIGEVIGPYTCDEFTTLQLICVSDYLITDYSSLALEGALLNKKIYYYLYDKEEYISKNGLNIDISKMMPTYTYFEAGNLINDIKNKKYDFGELNKYKEIYLPKELGHATENIVDLIEECLC